MSDTLALSYGALDRPLPPRWDGEPVVWREWAEPRWTTHRFHAPVETCAGCGSIAPERTCVGEFRGLWRFVASRCPGCGLDTVFDQDMDEVWTLDASDYGPDGSTFDGVIESLPPAKPLRRTPPAAQIPDDELPNLDRRALIAQARAAIAESRQRKT